MGYIDPKKYDSTVSQSINIPPDQQHEITPQIVKGGGRTYVIFDVTQELDKQYKVSAQNTNAYLNINNPLKAGQPVVEYDEIEKQREEENPISFTTRSIDRISGINPIGSFDSSDSDKRTNLLDRLVDRQAKINRNMGDFVDRKAENLAAEVCQACTDLGFITSQELMEKTFATLFYLRCMAIDSEKEPVNPASFEQDEQNLNKVRNSLLSTLTSIVKSKDGKELNSHDKTLLYNLINQAFSRVFPQVEFTILFKPDSKEKTTENIEITHSETKESEEKEVIDEKEKGKDSSKEMLEKPFSLDKATKMFIASRLKAEQKEYKETEQEIAEHSEITRSEIEKQEDRINDLKDWVKRTAEVKLEFKDKRPFEPHG